MNSCMYDDGCQDEPEPQICLYTTEQEYWEEMDRIHALQRNGQLA